MKSKSTLWGWLTFCVGLLGLYLSWREDAYMLFSWIMAGCSLHIGWMALTRLRLGPTQWLLVGGCLLNAAAGTANGLVMAANGGRMPVEDVRFWDTPAFLDSEGDRHGLICGFFGVADDNITPIDDAQVHYDVPPPYIMHGKLVRPQAPPNLDFLDDRQTVSICGRAIVYSKGDAMGFIGTIMLGIPGLILLVLGFLWRLIRRKPRAPVD